MKFGYVGAMAVVLLGAGWAAAQTPAPPPTGQPIPHTPSGGPALPVAPAPAQPTTNTGQVSPPLANGTAAPAYTTPTTVTGPASNGSVQGFNGLNGHVQGLQSVNGHGGHGSCADGSCGSSYFPSGHAEGGAGGLFYGSAEYLLWHIQSGSAPNLSSVTPVGVLTVPTQNILIANPGLFSLTNNLLPVFLQANPGTTPLQTGEHSGGRFTAGYWLDTDRTLGFEGSFFFVERLNGTFAASNTNTSNPFAVNTGLSNNLTIITPTFSFAQNFPVIFLGQASAAVVGSSTTEMWGGEANVRCIGLHYGCLSLGALAGFRYLDFSESLSVNDTVGLTLTPQSSFAVVGTGGGATTFNFTPPPANIQFVTADSIRTHNHFYGGQIGADADIVCGGFFFNARGKLGLGAMHEVVNINNSTTTTQVGFPGPAVTTGPGGLLTSGADIGQHGRNRICFLPEGNLRFGYCFNRWVRAWVGYDALYISNAVRPGSVAGANSISATVNVAGVSNMVNVQQPAFRFADTNVFAQGVNFGVEFTY
jgi:hypothetical protein